jgi:predicted permease
MLSYGYWKRRFGGDRTVIGRNITVDSRSREIVGVMPQGFQVVDQDFDVATPLVFDRGKVILAGFGFHGIARLRPGATIAEANADLTRMVPIWMDSWSNGPGTNSHIYEEWRITPMIHPLKQEVIGNVGELLWVVMGTIGVVLLIACANVTNLLLVRVEARQQELAVRAALGAGTMRIVRGLLAESVMLGLMGGVVGVGLACAGVQMLVAMGPANLPRLNEIAIDGRTLGFALLLSVLSGLLFGLIPALKYARPGGMALQSTGRTIGASRERHRARNLLVVGQVAMAMVLLISAGLMIRTFAALRKVDPGFADPQHLQVLRISIPDSLIREPEEVTRTQGAIVDKLSAIQGVKSVGFASAMPMEGFDSNWDEIYVEGKVYAENVIPPLRLYKYVSPGLLQTAGTRLVAGREMTWNEVYGLQPVVMVSENLAREMWGTASAAVGKHVREFTITPWHEVIGVVQDVPEKGVQEKAPEIVYWAPVVYWPFVEPKHVLAQRTMTFVIRSDRAGTESFLNEVRTAVWSVNAELPLASVRTMQDVYDKSMARTSFTLVMLGIAGAMALTLGIIGIYGVMSYTVSQRKREIGIRLALGAQDGDVLQMVLRQGTKLALVGVLLGIGAALGLTRVMSNLLYGVTAHDPLTFAGVAALLILVAVLACYIPARRATLVDPMVALRYE